MSNSLPRWPEYTEEEVEAASQVIKSGKVNYWTGGEGKLFEQEYAASIGVKHAIALSNGSVALEVALRALGVGPGDEVVVSPRSFIASASCVPLVGAIPVFADVSSVTGNLTRETIEAVLSSRTKAVIPVHLGGLACEMDGILELAREKNLKIIEDCAQAHGATYKGRAVGSMGDVGAFSFCQDKILSTGGEGGMVTTNSSETWNSMWSFKDHGKSFDTVVNKSHPPGFRWLHESFGTNLRMTEMQAAIGRVQLARLRETVERRRENARVLKDMFRSIPAISFPCDGSESESSYYRLYCILDESKLAPGWTRDRIMNAVVELGAPCFSGSCSEIYLEKAFVDSGFVPPESLPNAKRLGDVSLMFPVYSTLKKHHMTTIGEKAVAVLERSCCSEFN